MKKEYTTYLSLLCTLLMATTLRNSINRINSNTINSLPTHIGQSTSKENDDDMMIDSEDNSFIKHEAIALRNNHIVTYGNDISHYQGNINFTKYASLSSFAICKLGEDYKVDPTFYTNVTGAIENNIDVGAYLYSHADNEEEARKEARFVISTLDSLSLRGKLTYPIYFDYEENSIKNRTKEENTKIINAFCEELLSYSYYPALYIGGNNYLNYTIPENINCDIWIAHYYNGHANEKIDTFFNRYQSKRVTMWQFDDGTYNLDSIKASDLGISSAYVDQNYAFVDYPSIIKEKGFN
ncbi:MAG: GH25 family lysozyme [Bacilli bacterium]